VIMEILTYWYSIVLGMTALRIWPILDEEYFVWNMRTYGMVYVECEIVTIPKLEMVKHVMSIKDCGTLTPYDMLGSPCLVFEEYSDALKKKDFHGCLRSIMRFTLMMMHLHLQAMHLQHQIAKTITLLHHGFIVWKQFALHVVLLSPGPSLLAQNHPQIS
jgi:hypothetical protein